MSDESHTMPITVSKQLYEMLLKEAAKKQTETGKYYWVERVVNDILENWADPSPN